jgi:hypothetical protein
LDELIVRVVDPLSATEPIPLSIDALAASEDVQIRVVDPPPDGRLVGLAENVPEGAGEPVAAAATACKSACGSGVPEVAS